MYKNLTVSYITVYVIGTLHGTYIRDTAIFVGLYTTLLGRGGGVWKSEWFVYILTFMDSPFTYISLHHVWMRLLWMALYIYIYMSASCIDETFMDGPLHISLHHVWMRHLWMALCLHIYSLCHVWRDKGQTVEAWLHLLYLWMALYI